MSIRPRGSLCIFTLALTVFAAWAAPAAHAESAGPSADCQQHFHMAPYPPSSTTDNRYALLLMFDAASAAGVHTYFHTMPSDTAHYGCVGDPSPSAAVAARAKAHGKPPGIGVQGSCPTDCIPPWIVKKGGKSKKVGKASSEDPLDGDAWGIFSADENENQILVWQILTKNATHASKILAQLKGDSTFPKASYRGHILVGFSDPSDSSQLKK